MFVLFLSLREREREKRDCEETIFVFAFSGSVIFSLLGFLFAAKLAHSQLSSSPFFSSTQCMNVLRRRIYVWFRGLSFPNPEGDWLLHCFRYGLALLCLSLFLFLWSFCVLVSLWFWRKERFLFWFRGLDRKGKCRRRRREGGRISLRLRSGGSSGRRPPGTSASRYSTVKLCRRHSSRSRRFSVLPMRSSRAIPGSLISLSNRASKFSSKIRNCRLFLESVSAIYLKLKLY